jgi:hypothetical protein
VSATNGKGGIVKSYPKAFGLFAAWIRSQDQRKDLVGEFARAVNQPNNRASLKSFRESTWREWALKHGLTDAHVDSVFREYAHVSTEEKRAAYDKSAARSARSVIR